MSTHSPAPSGSADLLARAADELSWALDLLDMYDVRMVQLGDPREKVYSDPHIQRKSMARLFVAELQAKGKRGDWGFRDGEEYPK